MSKINFLRLDYSKCSDKNSAMHKATSEGHFKRNEKELKRNGWKTMLILACHLNYSGSVTVQFVFKQHGDWSYSMFKLATYQWIEQLLTWNSIMLIFTALSTSESFQYALPAIWKYTLIFRQCLPSCFPFQGRFWMQLPKAFWNSAIKNCADKKEIMWKGESC